MPAVERDTCVYAEDGASKADSFSRKAIRDQDIPKYSAERDDPQSAKVSFTVFIYHIMHVSRFESTPAFSSFSCSFRDSPFHLVVRVSFHFFVRIAILGPTLLVW